MEENTKRAEAERLLGIAEKLLQSNDFNGARDFAILAQETVPSLEASYQILAVLDVLVDAGKRINNHHDWYAILQIDRRTDDLELIKKQYRRLAFLLHPDKNKFAFADSAFRLVADAWAVLSDAGKKSIFDSELGVFSKVDLVASRNQRGQGQGQQPQNQFRREPEEQLQQQQKLPVRRSTPWAEAGSSSAADRGGSSGGGEARPANIWTACPYCYNLYEYPKAYLDCCLRCQNCERAFHAAEISSLPPLVPGKEAYYACWGFFPMGFATANVPVPVPGKKAGKPKSTPLPKFRTSAAAAPPSAVPNVVDSRDGFGNVPQSNAAPVNNTPATATPAATTPPPKKKRGRPKKNVQSL